MDANATNNNQSDSAQHTPGPWTYNQQPVQHLGFYIQQDGFRANQRSFIGEVGGGDQSMEEVKANANLIAAAPELLRQLEIAVKHIENIQKFYKPEHPFAVAEYKAVINKAKGGQNA